MEKSPGTRTVSMFGGCWLTGIASCTSLINSSLALCRCLTYLQHSSCSSPGVSLFVFVRSSISFFCTTHLNFKQVFLHLWSSFNTLSLRVWEDINIKITCLTANGVPVNSSSRFFWVTLQYLSGSSSTLIHWVTWRKSVRFACVLLNVCPGPRVWSSSLTLSEFVCEKKCKRRSWDMAKISFLGLGRSQCQTLFRSDHSMTDPWRNMSNYAKSLWHPRFGIPNTLAS